MSVQSEINRIKTAVGAAYDAIETKGGAVPASETVEELATAINSIPSVENVVTTVNGHTGDVTGAQAVDGAAITPASVDVGGAVALAETTDGRGVVKVNKADGTLSVQAYANTGSAGGEVDVFNSSGVARGMFYVATSGNGVLRLYNNDGSYATLTKARIDRIGATCNPNLLDNWYFANPVNQRGQTSYTGEVYGIDRWIGQGTGDGSVSIVTGGIKLYRSAYQAHLLQRIEYPQTLAGKTVTLSALGKNLRLYYVLNGTETTTSASISSYGAASATITLPSTVTGFSFELIADGGVTDNLVVAVKLELGDTQTLAHQDASGNWVLNEIPNYAEQLGRCQRYLYVLPGSSGYSALCSGVLTNSQTQLEVSVPLPVPMRTQPAIVGTPSVVGVRTVPGTNITPEISYVGQIASEAAGQFDIAIHTPTFTGSAYTNNTPIALYLQGLVLSAEL